MLSNRLPDSFLSFPQLQCDELVMRTAIICAEKNDFSQIVSIRLFELHGAWNFTQENNLSATKQAYVLHKGGEGGTRCPYCRNGEKTSVNNSTSHLAFFQLYEQKVKTPLCSDDELQVANGQCRYTLESLKELAAMREFNRNEGLLIHRIRSASDALRFGSRSN